MGPFIEHFTNIGFSTELIYSFVIIICSLMVYLGTKELYELSSHKGLKYFRQAFLFFALAYFFRSFIQFMLMSLGLNIRSFENMGVWILFLFLYASTLAILYLLYSVKWKTWKKHPWLVYVFHVLAIAISLVSIFVGTITILLLIQILLFIFVALTSYPIHKKQKKKHNLYAIYLLLFAFWILNVISILIPDFLQTFNMLLYLASITILLLILYKVIKKTGAS